MPTSRIFCISRWGIGIACIFGMAACGAAEPPAVAPGQPASQAAASAAGVATATPANPAATVAPITSFPSAGNSPTATPAVPATQLPAAAPEETGMPDQKPPNRPTLQLEATLMPEGAAPATPPGGAPPAPAPVPLSPVEVAKADLARRRNIALDTIRVVEVRSVTWPDPGLGCPQPGMAYKQVPVDGLLIRLESEGQIFEYHSGGSKAPFLCENPSGGDKATPVSGGEGQ